MRGVDSYSTLKIGYVAPEFYEEKGKKRDKDVSQLRDKLKKI